MQSILLLAILFSLFGEDSFIAAGTSSSDDALAGLSTTVFVLFALELIARACVDNAYIFALSFWLDLATALSIIPDVSFMSHWLVPDYMQRDYQDDSHLSLTLAYQAANVSSA